MESVVKGKFLRIQVLSMIIEHSLDDEELELVISQVIKYMSHRGIEKTEIGPFPPRNEDL